MRRVFVVFLGVSLALALSPAISKAASQCPEVDAAKEMLQRRQAGGPKTLASVPGRPEGSDAPRAVKPGEDPNAPRTSSPELDAPRGPKTLAGVKSQAHLVKAKRLIIQAEAACKQAVQKAQQAMELLQ